MNKFGLDFKTLEYGDVPDYPTTVPGRVLQVDGDFICYFVTCHEDEPWSTMVSSAEVQVETLRLLAGAEKVKLHLTAHNSTKGGRGACAIQKEYQGNRRNKVKPKRLEEMRIHLRDSFGAAYWLDQEADDGMCQANWKAIQNGTPHLSVIASKDKDLTMCQGWHLDWDIGRLYYVDGFGEVHVDRSKSSPKCVGSGYKFFWAQMLMGDTADNIQGIPKIPGKVLNKIKPTKAITNAYNVLNSDASAAAKTRAQATLDKRAPGLCGPVVTAQLLEQINDNATALRLVTELYRWYGENVGFTHYESGEPVAWPKVFWSEANMLWMRQYRTQPGQELDVVRFIKNIKKGLV